MPSRILKEKVANTMFFIKQDGIPRDRQRDVTYLIPQMEMQLNLQRLLRTVPKFSAYAHYYGPYDYNAHPLAPLCSTVDYHAKPSTRVSSGMRSVSGWYIGVSLEHYLCHRCWITETKVI